MKYHELQVEPNKAGKRVGRGISAGQGKTAGRGTKGQKARTGSSAKPGFAGGQNPLMQKLPKLPGFKSHKTPASNVYTGELQAVEDTIVDANTLTAARLISNPYVVVKLIVKGDVAKAFTVNLPLASKSAIAAIEAAGGSFNKTARLSRDKTSAAKIAKAAAKAK